MRKIVSKSIGRLMFQQKLFQQRRNFNMLYGRMKQNFSVNKELFDKEILREYSRKWKPIKNHCALDSFLLYSSIEGYADLNYVPDYLYAFPMRQILQNTRYDVSHDDKNTYESRLQDFRELFPKSFLRMICGVFYDQDYRHISDVSGFIKEIDADTVVAKESIDIAGGKGVRFFSKKPSNGQFVNDKGETLWDWMQSKQDLVVQQVAKQSSFFSDLNTSSINTIRVVTYRSVSDEKIHVIQSRIRVGSSESQVDNWHSGGQIIGVNKKGKLADYGFDENFAKRPFEKGGVAVPHLEEMYEIAKQIAQTQLYHRHMTFDFYIDENEQARIIEINYDLSPWAQFLTGPLYGEFTDEVIDYCAKSKGWLQYLFPFYLSK